MRLGEKVYHVANPDIVGVVTTDKPNGKEMVSVTFSEPVGFSGNWPRGRAEDWICTKKLLHASPSHARLHSNGWGNG